jgi:Protein of unknown function (DUF2851)
MMEIYLLNEPRAKYPERQKVLERLLHCIWSEQLFRKALEVNGKKVIISSPGWWNLEAGPDFRSAELFLDGTRLCGDVEVHLNSDDWYQHHHHEDPRYNQVILHVVLYKSQEPCRKQNGELILQLEMKDSLLEELRLLQQKIPIHQFPFGPEVNVRLCRKFLEEQEDEAVLRIIDSAGDLRMRRKKEDFLQRLNNSGFAQAFYEGVMEGMGYKQSRYAFRELAKRVPLEELMTYDQPTRRGIDSMAAILLGTAGLLQDLAQPEFDRETNHYMDEVRRHWKRVEDEFNQRQLVGFCWYPSSTRPANFPARRLTAIAAFFHYFGRSLLTLLLQPVEQHKNSSNLRPILRNWFELFSKPVHIYWSYHFQFDGNKFSAPKRLIGKERSKILVVNVVIPSLLAWAQIQGDNGLEAVLHRVYRVHPLLCENSITRLMKHRLFGPTERSKKLIRTAHHQQALHHFFYDFCDNRESSCSRCELKQEQEAQED